MERRLTAAQASELYGALLEIFAEDVSLKCKKFLLRQQLEYTVRLIAQQFPGYADRFKGDSDPPFGMLMNHIFDSVDRSAATDKLKDSISKTKTNLNKVVHNISFSAGEDLKLHLRRVLDLINFFSGAPIPNKLQDATRRLESVKIERALDVIILNEMFDSTDEVGVGATICNELLSMMRGKDALGFGTVNFYLINYMPSVLYISTVKDNEASLGTNAINVALNKAMMVLKERIKKYKKRDPGEAFKPMFLWICNSLSKELDKAKMQELVALSKGEDGDNYTFYPIVIRDEGVDQFKAYNAKWKAKVMIPQLIENFTFSLLLSIQRADAEKKK